MPKFFEKYSKKVELKVLDYFFDVLFSQRRKRDFYLKDFSQKEHWRNFSYVQSNSFLYFVSYLSYFVSYLLYFWDFFLDQNFLKMGLYALL